MTLTATSRHTQGASMRHFVLFVYIIAACWVAWSQRESAWFVLHATGAVAAICAAGLALSYAGALGEITPDDDPDQAEDYITREDWDD